MLHTLFEHISLPFLIPLRAFLKAFVRPGGELFFVLFIPQLAILAGVRLAQRRAGKLVWPRVFPRSALRRRSTAIDISLSIFEYGAPLVSSILLIGPVARTVRGVLPSLALGADLFASNHILATACATLATLVAVDFGQFVAHWLHHKIPMLWAFHAVHHSAPEMTPLTASRVHPVEVIVARVVATGVAGFVLGLWTAMVQPVLSVQTVFGAHAAFLLFQLAFSAVRHSSIPISFGPIERVLVSPRMHQLHHSNDPAHYDQNFGQILSVWDAMIGRRLRTMPPEGVRFGVTGINGDSFRATLLSPFPIAAKSALAFRASARPTRVSRIATTHAAESLLENRPKAGPSSGELVPGSSEEDRTGLVLH